MMNLQNACKAAYNKQNSGTPGKNKVITLNISQFELTKILYSSGLLSECDLTPSAKLFLWALCSHYNPDNETMFPSQQTVAKKLGISEKSAQRAVKELKTRGLIDYETKWVNHYVFGPKFFELVKMSGVIGQNVRGDGGQNVLQTNNKEKINNRRQIFSKKVILNDGGASRLQESVKGNYRGQKWNYKAQNAQYKQDLPNKMVPDANETKKMLEEREKNRATAFNPYECSKDEAFEWLKAAPDFWIKKSKIAEYLVKKYKFAEFEHILKK